MFDLHEKNSSYKEMLLDLSLTSLRESVPFFPIPCFVFIKFVSLSLKDLTAPLLYFRS